MNAFDLTGRTALVTGASRGIGRAIAIALAEAGADLALVARSEEALSRTAEQVEERGRNAVVLPCDVTQRDETEGTVARAIERLGHLDIAVNNAGGQSFAVPFLDIRPDGWEKVMRLNLDSVMYVCRAVGRHMTERGSGSIINVSSVVAVSSAPLLAPYGAAKAALVNLTKTLAVEWASNGVRVNALCPGWTATDLNRNLWEDEQASQATIAGVPMGRWGNPDEMSAPALFLASDASAYMTGQALVIDGGMTVAP